MMTAELCWFLGRRRTHQKSHLIEVSFSAHVCLADGGTGIDGLIAEIEEEEAIA